MLRTRPGTIRKFKLEYYYSNTTIRKKPMVSTGYNYSNSIRIVIISNSTRSNNSPRYFNSMIQSFRKFNEKKHCLQFFRFNPKLKNVHHQVHTHPKVQEWMLKTYGKEI